MKKRTIINNKLYKNKIYIYINIYSFFDVVSFIFRITNRKVYIFIDIYLFIMKLIKAITLDMDIVAETKIRGLNLSGTINNLLRAYLNLPDRKIEGDMMKLKKELDTKLAETIQLKQQIDKLTKPKEKNPYEGIEFFEEELNVKHSTGTKTL